MAQYRPLSLLSLLSLSAAQEIIDLRRRRHLNPSLSMSFKRAHQMVRGQGAYLFDRMASLSRYGQ